MSTPVQLPAGFDTKALVSRLLTAGVAAACVKFSEKTGVVIDSGTQVSIALGVYALLHKAVEHLIKR